VQKSGVTYDGNPWWQALISFAITVLPVFAVLIFIVM
jgi:hypothetical protein